MINYILFDLDGTLTDPGEGITNSAAYALKKHGIDISNTKDLFFFIGPPLKDSFMTYGMSESEAEQAIKDYREYYIPYGINENILYPGMDKMLSRLKESGKTLIVATSKPEQLAKKVLENFDILKYFDYVCGASMDEKLSKKEEIIEIALNKSNATKSQAIMVGDRKFDIEGAHKNQIPAIGVLYGYGNLEEFRENNAEFVSKNVEELEKILLSI